MIIKISHYKRILEFVFIFISTISKDNEHFEILAIFYFFFLKLQSIGYFLKTGLLAFLLFSFLSVCSEFQSSIRYIAGNNSLWASSTQLFTALDTVFSFIGPHLSIVSLNS